MKQSFFLIIVGLLLPVISIAQGNKKATYEIIGELRGLNNDSIILFINNYDDNGLRQKPDTVITVAHKNKFYFKGEVVKPGNAIGVIGSVKSRRSFSIFIEKGKIKISGTVDSLHNITVTGTTSNNDQTSSRAVTEKFYNSIKAPRLELKDKQPDLDDYKNITTAISKKFDSIQLYELDFIKTHPRSLMSGTFLYVLEDKIPLEQLEELYSPMSNEIKQSGFGSIVREKIVARKRVIIGNPAPDFVSTDTSGKSIRLSSFRGKYVLLEFGANWCVPCRQQSPHLVEMYKKYSDKGFTIIQYSVDEKKDEEKWKAAIRKDQLTWTQLADLNGFENKVSKLYGVQPIPDNFLIDPSGKIIGRRVEGKELEEKLKKLLQ